MRIIFIIFLLLFQSLTVSAESRDISDHSLANEIKDISSSVESEHFIVWFPRLLFVGEAKNFTQKCEQAYYAIEKVLSRSFDVNHYHNRKIEVFIGKVGASHVYGGYRHASYEKPWIYLPITKVIGGDSPYSHELTHIIAWNYSSHSLREGLACWIQIKLYEAKIGLNTKNQGFTNRSEADSTLRSLLKENKSNVIFESMGSPGIPSRKLTKGGKSRSYYYTACYSFVAFLLDSININTFMKLYEADDLPNASKSLTGKDMDQWRNLWIRYLTLENPRDEPSFLKDSKE